MRLLAVTLLVAAFLASNANGAINSSKAIIIAKRECAITFKDARPFKGEQWRAWLHGTVWYAILSNNPRHQWCGSLNVQVDAKTGEPLRPGAPDNMETCYGCVY
jgi:hypothetical protein